MLKFCRFSASLVFQLTLFGSGCAADDRRVKFGDTLTVYLYGTKYSRMDQVKFVEDSL